MPFFLISGLGFVLWSLLVIVIYYSDYYSSINHLESATGFGGYLITLGILYAGYKWYTVFFAQKKELRFGFTSILLLTLLHILIICILYSGLPEIMKSPLMTGNPSGVLLFIHIIKLILYPIVLMLLARGVGYTILNFSFDNWRTHDMRIRFPLEGALGFAVFTTLLLICGMAGFYTLETLLFLLVVMVGIGFPGLRETYEDIRTRSVVIENHQIYSQSTLAQIAPKLLSIEFGFLLLTFLFSVALINIIRPMPIGWDDLGVYMNYPKLMATSGELLHGASLFAWQLITGTGYFFSYTAAQAFYINQIGGILAVIAIITSLSYIFEEKGKKSFISLPTLLGLVYYALPMTVFQQVKDMKLDPALLFFSISAFLALFSLWKEENSIKENLKALFLAGILTGFAFSVKVTTLMLILGGLGLIAYRYLSFLGYLGFFSIFLGVFTYGNLWAKMNVVMTGDPMFIKTTALICIGIGIMALIIAFVQAEQRQKGHEWFWGSLLFLLGVILSLSPWLIKNSYEAQNFSIDALINGSGGLNSHYSYKSLYTPEEVKAIEARSALGMTASGQSQNEDMGRYFGYEKGLNNYLKLPANLTYQKNQGGEFTEISYIFLALVPGLLLFVRSRKEIFALTSGGIILFMLCYYFLPGTGPLLTDIFNNITLDKGIGYGILLIGNILYLTLVHKTITDTEENRKLKDVLIFAGVYGFIFAISAFGIVWYGIFIYYLFFLMMGLSASIFVNYTTEDEESEEDFSIKTILSCILFIFISVYLLRSAFPHGWNNLRSAYYNEYKYNILSQEESIFAYRSDYLIPIATMNLKDTQSIFTGIEKKVQSPELKKLFASGSAGIDLERLHRLILQYISAQNVPPALRADMHNLGKHVYSTILYPPRELQNTGGIYRIGTFMTYLISNNLSRYLDDSLVFLFNDYFYTDTPEKTIDRMRQIGLKYLLVDLNAATIDKDPRHALTDRFEKLLYTMSAKNLRLVSTDNFCLELALDERKNGRLQTRQEFLDIAGTNYESYGTGGVQINRGIKLLQCQQYIIQMLNDGRGEHLPVIQSIKNEIVSSDATKNPKKVGEILAKYVGQSWFVLFEILDTPVQSASLTQTGNTLSGTTNSGSVNK